MFKLILIGALVGLTACGDSVKKRSTVDSPNNTSSNNTANNATNNTTSGSTNNTTSGSTNNTTSGSTNNTTNGSTNNTTNGSTNNSTNTPVPCGTDAGFFGPIGSATTTPYGFDANLNAVLAAIPAMPDDINTVENEGVFSPASPIQVNQAIVTATGSLPSRGFWIQDKNRAIEVFLSVDLGVSVLPGQIVSFNASELTNYEGHPEITGIDSFFVHSSNNPVPYLQANNRDVSMNDYGYIVKLGGELLPNPVLCGGTKTCYDLEHSGRVSTLRSGSTFLSPGDCVTYVGPVRSFPGPRGTTGTKTPQLDTINFDWLRERF